MQIELADGSRLTAHSISPEPGFGFITLCPHPEDAPESPPLEELIVPVGTIRRITVGEPEPARARFGFSLPSA